jgi:UDP-N-acetyl-D-mannosaminuronic acid dehydrogenase
MARLSQKIIVMGLGYIGLPTASMLATKGHQVLGVDVIESAVAIINSGRIHIIEPDLDTIRDKVVIDTRGVLR